MKWNGWGFKDSQFVYDPIQKVITFSGQRYEIGEKRLPLMRDWAIRTLGINFDKPILPQVKSHCSSLLLHFTVTHRKG